MAKLINPKTGEAIETEDKHVAAWIKEGFEPAVLMKDSEGSQAYVPASQAQPLFESKQAMPVGERQIAPISKTESGIRGAAQGLSLGFSDELTGAFDAVKNGLLGDKTMSEAYKQGRDEARANNEAAKTANPGTYGVGAVAGAIAPTVVASLVTGGAAAPVTLAAAARAGAVGGALNGLGTSNSETVGGMAADTAKGAAIGGVTAGALKGAANTVSGGAKASEWLAEKAASTAPNEAAKTALQNLVTKYAGESAGKFAGKQGAKAVEDFAGKAGSAAGGLIGAKVGMPFAGARAGNAIGRNLANGNIQGAAAGTGAAVLSPFKAINSVLEKSGKAGDLRQGTSNAITNYSLQQSNPAYRDAVRAEDELYQSE